MAEKERLEKQINDTKKLLKKFPPGKFFCTQNGKYCKWYQTDGKKHTYIPKSNRKLAADLAAKRYTSCLLEDLVQEKRAVDFYLRHHNAEEKSAEQLFLKNPEYRKLVTKNFLPLSQELQSWTLSPYESNPKSPEQLIHKTLSGKRVRSKSEAIIDMCLFKQKIPFKYEAPLTLGDITFYPDFTIRHPKTGETFYWEHFGLVDDAKYCQNMLFKLQQYTSYGIYPSIQMITTFETKDNPLSIELIENLIQYYFL